MNREETIKRLCEVRARVASEVFGWQQPADCICEGKLPENWHFESSEAVMQFIENAVEKAIKESPVMVAEQLEFDF